MKKKKDKSAGKEEEIVKESESCVTCQEYLDGWKRALADYDNLKKQLLQEKDAMRSATKEDLVQQVVPTLDHFDQALKYKPKDLDKEVEQWLVGLLHVRSQLEQVLKGFGAEAFGEAGEMFDPAKHEAISEKTDKDQDDQIILEVLVRGWNMGEKVLRPASVIVNKI